MTLVLVGLAAVMLADVVARRTGLPGPVLLVVLGAAYSYLPGPDLRLDPELVLDVVMPPLLYGAAINSSFVGIRGHLRPIASLSVGLVVVTAVVVGAGLELAVGVPVAAGIALGAAVAPPDPVATLSIGRNVGLPTRLVTITEGEGLLNDATALTILQVAVAAALAGQFSVGAAVGDFLLVAAGGIAVGAAVGVVLARVRVAIQDARIDNALSLGAPFTAYVLADSVHVSGVLAVVVTGLWLAHRAPAVQSTEGRLQTTAVWRFLDFLLSGYVFLLIGEQAPGVVRDVARYPVATTVTAAVVTVGAVLLVRPVWILLSSRTGALLRGSESRLSGREIVVLSWAGTRGVITLAAAFSLPAEFPARDLLCFCAYVLVLVTLVGQGLTFAPLVRRLGVADVGRGRALMRVRAAAAAAEAGLRRLAELEHEDSRAGEAAAALRPVLESRLQRYAAQVDRLSAAERDDTPAADHTDVFAEARSEVIAAERQELLRWRDGGQLTDADLRVLLRQLDLRESHRPPPPA